MTPRSMLISIHTAAAMVVMAIVVAQWGWPWFDRVVATYLVGLLDGVAMVMWPDKWLPEWARRDELK